MGCPINDIRNFKASKQNETADNVVDIKSQAPIASLHHARAEEAEITVTLNPISEESTMQNVNAINDNNESETLAAKVKPMLDEINATDVISEDEILDRMKKIRRFDVTTSVVSSLAMTGAAVLVAQHKERNVTAAVGIGLGITVANVVSLCTLSRQKAARRFTAEIADEEIMENRVKHSAMSVAVSATSALICGAVIGRFLCKKN